MLPSESAATAVTATVAGAVNVATLAVTLTVGALFVGADENPRKSDAIWFARSAE